jgi:Leucine-rich repeat (LRR) protein
MEKLTQLSYINLSDNQLPCIPKVLGACPNLTQIKLNDNNITVIPGWLTKKCPKLEWVELLNNPVSNQPSPNDIFVLQ